MRHRRHAFALVFGALIVTTLSGCDNFEWGGSTLEIVPPPEAPGVDRGPGEERRAGELGLPRGTILFHVVRNEEAARLIPVGEVSGDSLRTIRRPRDVSPEAYESRFRDAVLEAGSEFTVFHRGARVGTFEVRGRGPATACGAPTATGVINTVAAATDVEEFLAFRRGLAPQVPQEYEAPQVGGRIRTYASLVAERLILQAGLPRPRGWAGAQRDLQAITLRGESEPEMAATYLVGDNLEVGPSDPRGYSVFYLADWDSARGYNPFFVKVTNYAETGEKAAPRLIDHLDWTEDGRQSVLLQIYGSDQAWFQVLRQTGERDWESVWEGGRC